MTLSPGAKVEPKRLMLGAPCAFSLACRAPFSACAPPRLGAWERAPGCPVPDAARIELEYALQPGTGFCHGSLPVSLLLQSKNLTIPNLPASAAASDPGSRGAR